MKRLLPFFTLAALAVAFAPRASADGPKPKVQCIHYSAEVRYSGLAYNHLVHIANSCDEAQDCVVTTDVNPEPQRVEVPGHEEVVVTTFMGSPARTFTPKVTCEVRK